MKRWMAGVAAGIVCVGLTAGCGSSNQDLELAARLIGTWLLQNVVIDGQTQTANVVIDGAVQRATMSTLALRTDGTFTETTGCTVIDEGHWSTSAARVMLSGGAIVGEGGGEIRSSSYGFSVDTADHVNQAIILRLFPEEPVIPGTPSEYQYMKIENVETQGDQATVEACNA